MEESRGFFRRSRKNKSSLPKAASRAVRTNRRLGLESLERRDAAGAALPFYIEWFLKPYYVGQNFSDESMSEVDPESQFGQGVQRHRKSTGIAAASQIATASAAPAVEPMGEDQGAKQNVRRTTPQHGHGSSGSMADRPLGPFDSLWHGLKAKDELPDAFSPPNRSASSPGPSGDGSGGASGGSAASPSVTSDLPAWNSGSGSNAAPALPSSGANLSPLAK
jgi:hypothetical protein